MRTALLLLMLAASAAPGQTPPPPRPPAPRPAPPRPPADDGGLAVRDASAGYIDSAAPADQLYFRADAGYGFTRPNRAEFFYAQSRPGGSGLPRPERSVDFTDVMAGAEATLGPRLSAFVELPVRFLNPEVNRNAGGLGDVAAGFKYVLARDCDSLLTFQLRAYAPSGDATLGLGTAHATLEPALLAAHRPAERLTLLGEFRAWTPIGGSDFAGEVLRYGLGGRYDVVHTERWRVAPTLEFVGWEVLGGQERGLDEFGRAVGGSAAGVSVLNLKIGCRVDVGERAGAYAGWGRPITGEKWYADVMRFEARWAY